MLSSLRGPVGFAKRAITYRSLNVARIVHRNRACVATPIRANSKSITIPELGIVIDPFRQEHILIAVPQLVSLKRNQGAAFRMMESGELETTVSGVSVLTQTLQDILVLHEVFGNRVYALQMPARTVVWDVGANIGMSSLFFAKCCDCDVIAYEPFPQTAEFAKGNISRNHLADRIEVVVAGISDRARKETLSYHHDWRGSNGLFGNTRKGPIGEPTRVEVDILDAVTEFERIRRKAARGYIIAKIDCEGAEYEIIRRLRDAECLNRIDALVLEIHKIPNEDPKALIAILIEAGMMIVRQEHLGDGMQLIYAVQVQRGKWT